MMTEHAPADAHPVEHKHPGARQYLGIAVVLLIITIMEVAVFYVPAMHPVMIPVLLSLSAVKFALVAMWYMHLKFDSRMFSWLFAVPMGIALLLILALLRLFGHLGAAHPPQ
jgi:cytochrome c oxidase subunit 4